MANTLTAFNPEYWTPTMQKTFVKGSVALGVTNTELRSDLKDGDTLHKPYGSYPRVQTYTKGTDITVKDLSSTDDTLTVSTAKVASFYVDDIDRIQNKYETIKEFATIAQLQLNNTLDQAVFAEYSNAGTTLDDGSIGGTTGNGIVFSVSNAPTVMTAMGRTLNSKKRLSPDRFCLIGPRMLETIQQYVAGRETTFGDTVGDNGKIGRRFGFDLMLSNNLPWTGTLGMATNPAEGDTVTFNGVTFEFRETEGDITAGNFWVDRHASTAATSVDNLVAAFNNTGTEGTNYATATAEQRQLLEESGVVATDATTSITFVAYGDIVVSETLSASADVWSSQLQYALAGVNKSIDLVTQVSPNVVFRDAQLRLGKYVHPWMLYGKKTFTRMQNNLVATKFNVSAWV